jgi:hypothetical protein
MRMTREEWDVWTRGSAMRRDEEALVREHAAWALGRFDDALTGR